MSVALRRTVAHTTGSDTRQIGSAEARNVSRVSVSSATRPCDYTATRLDRAALYGDSLTDNRSQIPTRRYLARADVNLHAISYAPASTARINEHLRHN
ncbi:hypothetical protein LSAT2_032925 [Lamellibrachia satsuma]|nr:hypothetical protein LSAT2_032925 [Lamellibrachia satsuma]